MRRAIALATLVSGALAATTRMGTDHLWDAAPAIIPLAHGDVAGFAAAHPQMGPLSLVLRAPLSALAGPGTLWAYRVGAFALLLSLVALGGLLARRAGAAAGVVAAALLVANPVTFDALRLGHPEELLGASLCVAAILLAGQRPGWGAVALGGALATKQWALIAVAPVLAATPPGARVRVGALAGGIAAALIAPVALLDPTAFWQALHNPAFGLAEMRTGNLWGLAAIPHHIALGDGDATTGYLVPFWLQHVAHPLVAALTIGAGALALRRRRVDPIALLAVLMLVRCALDPWDHAYYHAPFLVALVAWEVLEARRLPVVAMLSAAWLGLVFSLVLPASDVLYAAWAVPAGVWLTRRALRLAPARRPAWTRIFGFDAVLAPGAVAPPGARTAPPQRA